MADTTQINSSVLYFRMCNLLRMMSGFHRDYKPSANLEYYERVIKFFRIYINDDVSFVMMRPHIITSFKEMSQMAYMYLVCDMSELIDEAMMLLRRCLSILHSEEDEYQKEFAKNVMIGRLLNDTPNDYEQLGGLSDLPMLARYQICKLVSV